MGWRKFFRRRTWDSERARELDAYLDMETEDNLARGMSAANARAAARRKLGNTGLIREEIYQMNSLGGLEVLWQDLRYAARMLLKSKSFTAIGILSLMLGIGANTAVFSLVRGVLLRPLPYPQSENLMRLDEATASQYKFLKEHARSFAAVAGYRDVSSSNLVAGSAREEIHALHVTADFFRALGVGPAAGREFETSETQPNGPAAMVLSNALGRRAFGSDSAGLGQTVVFDGAHYTVVGVLPPGFWFPNAADAYVPLRFTGSGSDQGTNTSLIARFKPGLNIRQAQAEMTLLAETYNKSPLHGEEEPTRFSLQPFREWLSGDVRLKLLLLFGASGLLLLIASTNLAGLALARLEARQKEIAVRLAIGGTAGRLWRQFLVENLLLCTLGGLAGVLAAYWSVEGMLALIPFDIPASQPIQVDPLVLGFALAVTLATGVAFSLGPLLMASRFNVHAGLKASGRSNTGGAARQRTRSVLVVTEVALSVTLLVGAALLIQSLYRLRGQTLGFRPEGVLTFATPPDKNYARGPEYWNNETALLDRIRAIPGVHGAAAVNLLPLTGQGNYPAEREGHPSEAIGGMEIRMVSPEYLDVMGIPVRRGRGLTAADSATAPPVILVNETLARIWWKGANPIGDRVGVGRFHGKEFGEAHDPLREVVGVVGDTRTADLKEKLRPTVYLPGAQLPWYSDGLNCVVRAELSPALAFQLRQAIGDFNARQRIVRLQKVEEIVNATTADSRFDAWLFGSFAALALLLAGIGVYGLLAFAVARRTSEIGTRMALGASRGSVLRMVLRQGLVMVSVGLLVGLAGAKLLTKSLGTLLFGVKPTDVLSFAVVAVVLLAVGALASYIPARRATKVDPTVALRYE